MEAPDYRDIHRISEIFHQLRNTSNPYDLTKTERILGATAPEDEFMAIATWTGRCSLIHKLSPDKYPPTADAQYKVPDLFAVFEYEGHSIPTLIEVKSSYTAVPAGRIHLAKLSPSYRRRLLNYGNLVGLPVLIVQQIRPPGLWFLVALETVGLGGTPFVDLANDLSGLLLGTFSVAFRAGTKLVLQMDKEKVISETHDIVKVKGAYWQTSDGKKITKTASPMVLLFGLGEPIEYQDISGSSFNMTWEIPADLGFFNYQALRAAILWNKQLDAARFPWAEMLKSGKFPIEHSRVEAVHDDGDFFKYAITTWPQVIPSFLKSKSA
ncbi:MAG: hypothetical protein Q8O40_02885 [Chloroflexota bacterium]|nr:hypothetical protein [Chloroflexota bacterium]